MLNPGAETREKLAASKRGRKLCRARRPNERQVEVA